MARRTSILDLSKGVAFAALVISNPALAQDGAGVASDIIVTARRVEERLQDVPISITVLNQQELSNRNVVTAQDLAAYTPSLSANTNFGSDNSTFAIRGFIQDIGTAPSVGVYFADVVAPRGGSMGFPSGDGAGAGSFFDLQNVQVLKGPQGTLQGRNTTGGAVMLVPQKPTSQLEGFVEGSAGNYNMWRIQGAINVPISENIRIRIGADRQRRDGYLRNIGVDALGKPTGPRDFNDVNYTAVRASLVADITPDLENYFIASFSRSNTHGSLQKMLAAGDPATTFLGVPALTQLTRDKNADFYDVSSTLPNASTKNEQWQLINTTALHINEFLTIKNIVSYAQLKQDLNTAIFGSNLFTPSFLGAQGGIPVYFSVITVPPGLHTAHESTLSEEFQLQGKALGGRLNWQAGLYFETSKPVGGYSGNQTNVLGSCTNVSTFSCSDPYGTAFGSPVGTSHYNVAKFGYQDVGIYSQASLALSDQLTVTAGVRYTWDKQDVTSTQVSFIYLQPNVPLGFCLFGNQPYPTASNCSTTLQKKSNAPTWLIDLEYKPQENILGYVKYSRGYRTGNVKVDAPPAFVFTDPEKVDAYEVGVKASFRGTISGTFNVAGFYNKFSNQQIQLGLNAIPGTSAAPSAAPFNVGKSRIYGLEADLNVELTPQLRVSAGYAYLNTKVTAVVTPTAAALYPYFIGPDAIRTGDELALSPKNKYTITGTYDLPISAAVGVISLGATFTHTDHQRTNYGNRGLASFTVTPTGQVLRSTADLGIIQATNLLNLNVNWNSVGGSPLDIGLFATNVTKKKYYTYVPGLLGVGYETASVGAPRMYGIRAKVHF